MEIPYETMHTFVDIMEAAHVGQGIVTWNAWQEVFTMQLVVFAGGDDKAKQEYLDYWAEKLCAQPVEIERLEMTRKMEVAGDLDGVPTRVEMSFWTEKGQKLVDEDPRS